jgi:mono/diheme cytochrome c family protein
MVLKVVSFLSLFVCCLSCSSKEASEGANENQSIGKKLYDNNCAQCHGSDGKLGNSGATDLSKSVLPDEESKKRIKNGRNAMPPMAEVLGSEANIDSVVQYIKSFRSTK